MKNLFIDANIWLSLFHFSSDDLEQFSKLKNLIDTDIKLYIPEQIYNEVYRNRETKIKDALDKFEKFELMFPAFCKNYAEYQDFNKKYRELKDTHKEWSKKIKKDILNQESPADNVLQEFFVETTLINCSPEIINNAVFRYSVGNPPGKDKKYGDAINWECLLRHVPNGEDLFFISADKDYASAFDDKQFNLFLSNEWVAKKGSKIIFFKSLVEFLNKHFKDIELKTEEEKDELILGLASSPNFATTHSIISRISNFADWSSRQIEDICLAAINNNQVWWIIGDDDVNSFYKGLLSNFKYDKDANENVITVYERLIEIDDEHEPSIIDDDDELPF